MHFILGGKNQGKLNWYLTRNHATIEDVADGETMALDVLPEQAVINHLHRWIFRMVRNNLDPVPLLEQYLQKYPDAVILCDEIGCGVVPLDPTEREWREVTGRICCKLAEKAERVDRIFCGLNMRLK